MSKLTPESPRLFRPTLAAWIGLNESIFLEQLNFILTEVENKGKFADGKKWYRDTPRAFMVTYFPFWDESIVKRTIANLRADALILVRSDLNEDHRDRSLWYTINYPRLERLDGPVARITGKSEKRKEARKARKSKPDNYPDYAKVQNVLTRDEGTNSTSDSQQNVLLPPVQFVPTPKVSHPKDSKHKEITSPYGEGGKPPHLENRGNLEQGLEQVEESPPNSTKPRKGKAPREPADIPEAVKVYRAIAHLYPDKALWPEIAETVGDKPEDLQLWRDVVYGYISSGYHKRNIKQMLGYFRRQEIPTTEKQNGATKNGHYGKPNKRTNPPVFPTQADPDLYTRMQQAAIRAAADDPD